MTLVRSGRVCGVVVSLSLALGGCGGASTGSGGGSGVVVGDARSVQLSPAQLVSAATDKAQTVSSAKFAMTVATRMEGLDIDLDAAGELDAADRSLSLTAKVRYGDGNLTFHKRIVDGKFYVQGLPGVRGWAEVDPDDLVSGLNIGVDLSQMSDPTGTFALVSALSEDVHAVGTTTVRGEKVTRYEGTLNVGKAVGAASADSGPLKNLQQQARSMGFTTAPFTVYIDDRGLPVRVQTTLTASGAGNSLVSDVKTTQDYYDWGTPVTVTAPVGAKPYRPSLDLLK